MSRWDWMPSRSYSALDRRAGDARADPDFARCGDSPHDRLAPRDGFRSGHAADNPSRVEFDRLHGVSVDLEGAVLLIGFASLFPHCSRPVIRLLEVGLAAKRLLAAL